MSLTEITEELHFVLLHGYLDESRGANVSF